MTMQGDALAQAAAKFIGIRFRMHGADPNSGLDCVGLVACALEELGIAPVRPAGYGMRNSDIARLLGFAAANGLSDACGTFAAGDVLLVKPGPAQFHLLVAEGGTQFIHAHAGLRRIVRTPGPLPWPIVKHWRLAPAIERQV